MVANHWSDDGMVTIHRSGLNSGKFNLIFRCDSLGSCRRAKEKDVEVKKRLVQCARCDEKVCNADVFDLVLV